MLFGPFGVFWGFFGGFFRSFFKGFLGVFLSHMIRQIGSKRFGDVYNV